MAPTSETRSWDSLVTTTLSAELDSIRDNIVLNVPYLNYLEQTNGIKKIDGGDRIKANLRYAKNSTIKAQSEYALFDTTPQDNVTAAFYNWKLITGTLSIGYMTRRKNSGKAKIYDLIMEKKEDLSMSFREKINEQLLVGPISGSAGYNSEAPDSLLAAIPVLQTATYGGISRADTNDAGDTYWQNQVLSVGAWSSNGVDKIREGYRLANRSFKMSPINLIMIDGAYYDLFENDHVLSLQFPVTGKTSENQFNLGIETFKYKKATVMEDPQLDSTALAYGINSEFLKLAVDSQTYFKMEPAVTPSNQAATVAPMMLICNHAVSNMRKLVVWHTMTGA